MTHAILAGHPALLAEKAISQYAADLEQQPALAARLNQTSAALAQHGKTD